jgi:predicted methyltransferase
MKYQVCPNCEGEGTTVNPDIDGNGITQDEMLELGPDFKEDYMSGVYDVPCRCCKGKRVVTKEELHEFHENMMELRLMRMESGGY